jgi:hypothetical protein
MIDHLLKAFLVILLMATCFIVLDLIPMDEEVLNAEAQQESMSKDCTKPDGVAFSAKWLFFCSGKNEPSETN